MAKNEFHTTQVYTADEYVAFCGTHCDHIVTPEPYKSRLFAGLRQAVMDFGNRLEVLDTHVLMTVRKPSAGSPQPVLPRSSDGTETQFTA